VSNPTRLDNYSAVAKNSFTTELIKNPYKFALFQLFGISDTLNFKTAYQFSTHHKTQKAKFWNFLCYLIIHNLICKRVEIPIIHIFFIIVYFFWLFYQNIKLNKTIYHPLRASSRKASSLHNIFCCYNRIFK